MRHAMWQKTSHLDHPSPGFFVMDGKHGVVLPTLDKLNDQLNKLNKL